MSISKREVLYDVSGGVVRFSDWAVCTTTIGTMVEPFSPNRKHSNDVNWELFDATDEINRIDDLIQVPEGKEQLYLSGSTDSPAHHGGVLNHRVGK